MANSQILVVEDEYNIVQLMQISLAALGYDVPAVASSGQEALQKVAEIRPDLVLMDILLKGDMDGVETTERIRARFDIPVVYITGCTDDDNLQRAKMTEPYGYLLKPFKTTELYTTIEMALHKHEMEKKLKESEKQYRLLVENIPDVVWTNDQEGNTIFVSRNIEKIYGYTPEEIYNSSEQLWFGRIHPDDVEKVKTRYESLFKMKKDFDVEYRIQRRDGNWIWLHNRAVATYKKDGVIYADGVFSDITERKWAEEELKKLTAELEKSNRELQASQESFRNVVEKSVEGIIVVSSDEIVHYINPAAESFFARKAEEFLGELFSFPVVAGEVTDIDIVRHDGKPGIGEMRVVETEWKGEVAYLISIRDITERKRSEEEKSNFMSAVSHEIRTPLTSIRNVIFLIEMAGELNEKQREILAIATRNFDKLNRLINQILDISRIEAGGLEMNFEMVDIKSLATDTISILKHLADDKGITIVDEIPANLPKVYADKDKLEQVLTNLIDNAIKYTPKGGQITMEGSLCTNLSARYVTVSVSDTGIGISPEDQKKIFDRFRQVGSSPKAKGFGLGLAICKEIVKRHHGKIWVESDVGKGSKFSFILPLDGRNYEGV